MQTINRMREYAPVYKELEKIDYFWLNRYIEYTDTAADRGYANPISNFSTWWDCYEGWTQKHRVQIEIPFTRAYRVLYTTGAIFLVALVWYVWYLLEFKGVEKHLPWVIGVPLLFVLAVGFLLLGVTVANMRDEILGDFTSHEDQILCGMWQTTEFIPKLGRLLIWVTDKEPEDPRSAMGARLPMEVDALMELLPLLKSNPDFPPKVILDTALRKLDAEAKAIKAAELAHQGNQEEFADSLHWKKALTLQHLLIAKCFGLTSDSPSNLYQKAEEQARTRAGRDMAIHI